MDAIHRGETENGLVVSEAAGIGQSHDNRRQIPENFTMLRELGGVSKTTVRRVRDYGVLQERFAK